MDPQRLSGSRLENACHLLEKSAPSVAQEALEAAPMPLRLSLFGWLIVSLRLGFPGMRLVELLARKFGGTGKIGGIDLSR